MTFEAPTDSQLAYIRDLCTKQGYRHPDVISSKIEASRIIEEIHRGTYGAAEYEHPFGSAA